MRMKSCDFTTVRRTPNPVRVWKNSDALKLAVCGWETPAVTKKNIHCFEMLDKRSCGPITCACLNQKNQPPVNPTPHS